jgi:PiT family inorganic phosphate transporter
MFGLETGVFILLILCLLAACAFEFVNGFHDTANAVATVIYTNSLKPYAAVVLSAICNFLGVLLGGIGVAMGIVTLLPIEALVDQDVYHNIAMVLALLLSAIAWNLGTWYFGLPASSSHTLIGSIIGIGLGFSFLPGNDGLTFVNWSKAGDVGLSLLISPMFGFSVTIFLMFALRKLVNKEKRELLFGEPKKTKSPPPWIRGILILTCTGVSFSHGANDGQKGVGLMMLILISILPFYFSLDERLEIKNLAGPASGIYQILTQADTSLLGAKEKALFTDALNESAKLSVLSVKHKQDTLYDRNDRLEIRAAVLKIGKDLSKLAESPDLRLSISDKENLNAQLAELKTFTDYAPKWVILLISFSLGIGTMVGWKRIVLTIGEKIGKQHLTYAQGASAELVAASTIGLATFFKLPVSTTHVLSSGIAGSMVASKGIKNLRPDTIRNILLAWILTLPVTIIMSMLLFIFFRKIL